MRIFSALAEHDPGDNPGFEFSSRLQRQRDFVALCCTSRALRDVALPCLYQCPVIRTHRQAFNLFSQQTGPKGSPKVPVVLNLFSERRVINDIADYGAHLSQLKTFCSITCIAHPNEDCLPWFRFLRILTQLDALECLALHNVTDIHPSIAESRSEAPMYRLKLLDLRKADMHLSVLEWLLGSTHALQTLSLRNCSTEFVHTALELSTTRFRHSLTSLDLLLRLDMRAPCQNVFDSSPNRVPRYLSVPTFDDVPLPLGQLSNLKRLRISSGYCGMDIGCRSMGDWCGSRDEDPEKQFLGLAPLQELEFSFTMSECSACYIRSSQQAYVAQVLELAAKPPRQYCSEDFWLDMLEDLARLCEPMTELRSLKILGEAPGPGDERWTETRLAKLCRERSIALSVTSARSQSPQNEWPY